MTRPLWLIPMHERAPQLKDTTAYLRRRSIPHVTVSPGEIRERLARDPPPAAVVQGGPLTALLIDLQRWLSQHDVLTLILVERLTDDYESILLDRGAHDVVALPVSPRKLGSRIGALTRAAERSGTVDVIHAGGGVEIFPARRLVTVDDEEVDLTRSEFELLLTLARHRDEVVSREDLSLALGPGGTTTRALESHLSRLRVKLRLAGARSTPHAVRGVGYRIPNPPGTRI